MMAAVGREHMASLTLPGPPWGTAVVAIACIVVISRALKFYHHLKAVDSLPGLRIPFAPSSLVGAFLPETWWNPGRKFTLTWRKNKNVYDSYGRDTVSVVPFITGGPRIYTRSMKVGKQILVAGHKSGAFGKIDHLKALSAFWGPNVMTADGELWKKHRRIEHPAFNNETYASVWNTSRKLYGEMASVEGWTTQDVIDISSVNALTMKFSLGIITSVCFGLQFTWANESVHSGEMNIRQCLEIIMKRYIFMAILPSWAWKLPFPWIKRTRSAYDTLHAFMSGLVNTMRETIRNETVDTTGKRDLLSVLVRASEDASRRMGLEDSELISNIFAFLFAGQETTAYTLAATLAHLASDFDLQDKLVAQVEEVTRGREDDTLLLEDYGKLDKVLAAFYEAIRMYPPAFFLTREAKKDTILDISESDEPQLLSIEKGTQVVLDVNGIQYNTRYFSESEEFRASRWYKERQSDSDGKIQLEDHPGFGIGPRTCLGHKFASVEGVCFLASLLQDWRVEPSLAMKPDGQVETLDEWRGRVLQGKIEFLLSIKDVPLRLVRRRRGTSTK